MLGAELLGAARADQQARASRSADATKDSPDRRRVGPLEVVDHHHERAVAATPRTARDRLRLGEAAAADAPGDSARWSSIPADPVSWRRTCTQGHNGGAPSPCHVVAHAPEPPARGPDNDLLGEPGLPDPRLAPHQQRRALAKRPSRPTERSLPSTETRAPAADGQLAPKQESSPPTVRRAHEAHLRASTPILTRNVTEGPTVTDRQSLAAISRAWRSWPRPGTRRRRTARHRRSVRHGPARSGTRRPA